MNNSCDISIIIPFLNEEDNIERLTYELNKFVSNNKEINFEIILVNDGSADRSLEKIKGSIFPAHTKLINLSQNYGSHAALRAGILYAGGNFIVFSYADLQDPLENIILMFDKMNLGNDIVWAYRKTSKNSFFEELFSKGYARLMKKYVNKNFPENGFDIVMFNTKIREKLNQNIESNSSIFLQILNLGFKSESIEYIKNQRIAGKSKWGFSKKVKLLIDSFVAFSYMPIRLVSLVGISFFIVGIIWSGYIITRKLIFDDLSSGWPALISTLLIGFGITNISLGIIAEYLWRTLDASRRRPVFIIDEIIELNKNNAK
jgi:glycosyltransferase involved in cell wall biosynthesis